MSLIGVLLTVSDTAAACICGARPTVLDAFNGSDLVVIAKTLSIEKPTQGNDEGSITLVVEHVYKGNIKPGERLVFALKPRVPCALDLAEQGIGQSFLLYQSLQSKAAGQLIVQHCGRSTLATAFDDLLYLNDTTKRGQTRISGTLTFVSSLSARFQPAAGIKIQITGENRSFTVVTNANGVYELYGAPAGRYQLRPQVPPNWKVQGWSNERNFWSYKEELPEIELREGKHSYLNITYGFHLNP